MIYNLQEIYEIRKNMISYVLPSEIMKKIHAIEKEIGVKIIPERSVSSSSNYEPSRRLPATSSNHSNTNTFRTNRSSSSFQGGTGTVGGPGTIGRGSHSFSKRGQPNEDLSWENVRNFKTTKLEKKEGIDKKINDIRICLNKISAKNYDTQTGTIINHIQDCLKDADEDESVRKEALHKVAAAIFDIASTNKFFSEIYAKLYKSLVEISPIFHEKLDPMVANFMDSLKEIKYINPDIDYDAFCAYNKQNDKRKASAIFMTHMMKVDILAISQVVPIISNLVAKIEENMETANRLNEVEEMTEVLFLFLQEGFTFLFHATSERTEIDLIFAKIRTFATYKIKDKPSFSSRVIFKYMDLVSIMNKSEKK
jgi:hypothetical protein